MSKISVIVVFSVILVLSCSFQLQGRWSLTEIKDFPIIFDPVNMQVSDSVSGNVHITQNIVFQGCQRYQYLMEFNQNNIFISYSSIRFDQLPRQQAINSVTKCTSDAAKMHLAIRSNLVEVFYFQLVGNYLVFLNPKREIVFKFQRVQSANKVRNVRGVWNISTLKGTKLSEKVQIADTEMTLCGGKLIVGYALTGKYALKTRLIQNDKCRVKDLEGTILSSAFSRRIGNTLQIYDKDLNLVAVMNFISDIDLSLIQAQRQKAIEEARKAEEARIKLQEQKAVKSRQQEMASLKKEYEQQSLSLASAQFKNNSQDLLGIWRLLIVAGISVSQPQTEIYFVLGSNSILYKGGCNSYQFQYKLTDEKIKTIQIGQNKSSSIKCAIDDDSLYVGSVNKITKYQITDGVSEIRVKFTDSNGKVLYEMVKSIKQTNKNEQSLVPSPINPQPQPFVFQNGRYVFLILARRDLARKFTTITNNKITYSGCNNIEHEIQLVGENQVKITGGAVTNKSCANNNDSIFINAFNSITSFVKGKQAGSYVLKNGNNVDVINLSQF